MLSAICRPLAEPMRATYLSISVSMRLAVRPVSSIECGSAGRKTSSLKIEESRLPTAPEGEEPMEESVELPDIVPAVIIVMLRKDGKPRACPRQGQVAPPRSLGRKEV